MRTLQFAIVFAVTLSLAFSFSPQVFAGNNIGCISDPNPSSASGIGQGQPPRFVCNETELPSTWYIPQSAQGDEPSPGNPIGRVPIDYDPNAGPWVKHLQIDTVDAFLGLVVPGYTDELREFLVVGPNGPAWTDWHEVIMNQPNGEEWIFTTVSITTVPPSNVIIQSNPSTNEVWVDFDPPLQPGTTVDIIKTLEYVGPNPITLNTPQLFIEVWQYPTIPEREVGGESLPIDSTALLLAGAQTNAVWIMSALAVIGSVAFGALYVTSKKN